MKDSVKELRKLSVIIFVIALCIVAILLAMIIFSI